MKKNNPCKVTINSDKFQSVITDSLHLENKIVGRCMGHSDSFIHHVIASGYMSLSDFILFSMLYVNDFDDGINTIFEIAPVKKEYEKEITEAINKVYVLDDQNNDKNAMSDDDNDEDRYMSVLQDMMRDDGLDKLREVIYSSVYNALMSAKDY